MGPGLQLEFDAIKTLMCYWTLGRFFLLVVTHGIFNLLFEHDQQLALTFTLLRAYLFNN